MIPIDCMASAYYSHNKTRREIRRRKKSEYREKEKEKGAIDGKLGKSI